MQSRYLKYTQLALLVSLIVGANIWMYVIGPEQVVQWVGVGNIYLLIAILAFFGTISAFAAPFFYSFLAVVAFGGVNPIPLVFAATLGLFFGDSVFYYMAELGRWSVSGWYEDHFKKFIEWGRSKSDMVVQGVTYFYFGFTPLPNDLLMVALVAFGYSYRNMMLSIFLGDLTIALLITHMGLIWG